MHWATLGMEPFHVTVRSPLPATRQRRLSQPVKASACTATRVLESAKKMISSFVQFRKAFFSTVFTFSGTVTEVTLQPEKAFLPIPVTV